MTTEGLPSIDFTTLVISLSQTALVHLGDAHEPNHAAEAGPDGDPGHHLGLARQTIDLLGVLQEKTKGNLTGDEERILDQVLYDLRMRFVEISKEHGKPASPTTAEAAGAKA